MEAFTCQTKIISGSGAISALEQLHIRRLFLVCDPFFQKNGKADAVIAAAKCAESYRFAEVKPDPSVELVAEGCAALSQFRPDAVVALGGGSAMDTAKAMAYFSKLRPILVAIPTTSGSGSEVTDFAILTHGGIKHPLVDESLRPDLAILDSDLVASLPPTLIADGGFDLICHAVEAFVAKNANSFSDLLAKQAFQTAMESLCASFSGDTSVRGAIHKGATMAGIAFSNAGLGVCHAISHSLGGEFHIPHGRLNAILLPAVIDQNATVSCHRYAMLARAAGLSGGSDVMALRALKNGLLRLRRNLQLPETLLQAGVSATLVQKKMDDLVAAALADPCCKTNPVMPDDAMIRKIITEVTGRG